MGVLNGCNDRIASSLCYCLATLLCLVLLLHSAQSLKLSCRNEKNGQKLDWFELYKLPKNCSSSTSGTAYMYMTNKKQAWSFSSMSINDTSSLPGMTLEYLFKDRQDQDESFGYLLYNDQRPTEEFVIEDLLRSSSRGHSKGVLLFSDQSVVWLVHSFPKFPKLDSYKVDPAQCVYGQSMLCMSFDVDELSSVISQLEFSYPYVYESRLPESLEQSRPDDYAKLAKMVLGKRGTKQPFGIQDLTTSGGQRFVSIYKSSYFAGDLYTGLVAPHFKKSLLVQTWQNGAGGKLESDCSNESEQVMNIDAIDSTRVASCAFSTRFDHSKWVVDAEGSMFNCIGDVNRMESQGKRGGGTVCIKNTKSAGQYHQLVNSVAPCSKQQQVNNNNDEDH